MITKLNNGFGRFGRFGQMGLTTNAVNILINTKHLFSFGNIAKRTEFGQTVYTYTALATFDQTPKSSHNLR